MSMHEQMAEENMEKSRLKRKHADLGRQEPSVSQELTCSTQQIPTESDGVRTLIPVFNFINATLFISRLGMAIFMVLC